VEGAFPLSWTYCGPSGARLSRDILIDSDGVTVCPGCGTRAPEAARFCMACGAELATPAEQFRKTVTIVFCDVVGSTSLGERLDPERLSNVLREYFAAMKPVIERHGGSVAKFIGDAVVAVFGLPELHEDDALRAVRAAIEMKAVLTELNVELEHRWGVTIAVRTAINTGATAGAGLAKEQNFVAGDAANVAARLQQQAAPGEILLGESTYRLVTHAVEAEALPSVALAGKAKPVTTFRLIRILPQAEALPRRFDTPMIGRQKELSELEWAFQRTVEEGSSRLVTVIGEAGIGKSFLVREFLDRLRARANVLEGRCLPYGDGITYWPLAEAIKQAAAITDMDSTDSAWAKIAQLLRGMDTAPAAVRRIAELLGMVEPQVGAEELPWAVRSLFRCLAAEHPLVLVLDDVQWAEAALLDLIEGLQRQLQDAPILVVCVARPELLERRRDWALSVALAPLSRAESDLLLSTLLGDSLPPAEIRDRLAATAEGNPLFLEQLVSMLIDEGYLSKDEEKWLAARELASLPLPLTVQALLAARLEQLEPRERALLGRAAVIGQIFHQGALEALVPEESQATIERGLLTLARKELVQPDRSDLGGETAFSFHHLLIRDAAYESLTRSERAALHERFAAWLEQAVGERAIEYEEIVAYHLEQAHGHLLALGAGQEILQDLAARAGERLASAGRRARDRGDLAAAVGLLSRARALLVDDTRAPGLLVELGQALAEGGRFDQAEGVLVEAAEAATRSADVRVRTLAELAELQVRLHVDSALSHEKVEAAAAQAREVFSRLGDDFGAAQVWRLLFFARWSRSEMSAAQEAAEHALEHALRAGDPDHVRDRMRLLDALTFGPTPTSEALARAKETFAVIEGHRWAEANLQARMARLLAIREDYEHARAAMVEAVAYYEEVGALVKRAMDIAEGLGWYIEASSSDWHAAARELRRGFDLLESSGATAFGATVNAYEAHAAYALGQDEEAEGLAEKSAAAAASDDIWTQVLWRGACAKARARQGDAWSAEEVVREAVELALKTDVPELQATALLDLGEVARLSGRFEDARTAIMEALDLHERKEHVAGVARARRALAQLPVALQSAG
jgi:class 3 adenylate cyclase